MQLSSSGQCCIVPACTGRAFWTRIIFLEGLNLAQQRKEGTYTWRIRGWIRIWWMDGWMDGNVYEYPFISYHNASLDQHHHHHPHKTQEFWAGESYTSINKYTKGKISLCSQADLCLGK